MAESLPDLIARLRLDVSDMQQGVGKVSAIGGAIGGAIGATIGPAIGAALGKIREFVTGSVDAFAELEDGTAAAGVVFGDAMGAIIEQSKTAASTLGLSSQQVINAANTFGTYGKSAGLAGQDLAAFSTDMTGLAGDLASFKGTSTEQAIEAIGSALRGEAEPIRAYGVLLDDATLKARAMELGLISSTKNALTPQQKVLAAQAEILAQTGDAQGDFARTMDSTANVAKTLAAESTNLQAKLGTVLAPVFTTVRLAALDMIRGMSAGLDEWIPKVQAFYDRTSVVLGAVRELFTTGDFTGAIREALGVEEDSPLIGVLLGIRDAAMVVGPAVSAALAGIGPILGTLLGSLGASLGPLVPQIAGLALAFSPLRVVLESLAPLLPILAGAIGRVVGTLAGALGAILPALIQVGQTVSGVVVSALSTLLPVVLQVALVLAGALAGAVRSLAPVIVGLVPVIGQLLGVLGGVVTTVLGALAPVVTLLARLIAQLLPPVVGLIAPLLGVVTAVLPLVGVLGQLIGSILPPLVALFTAVITPVVGLAGQLATALVPILNVAATIIGGVLVPILAGLVTIVSAVITWVLRLAGPVLGGLTRALGAVIGWVANVIAAYARWIVSLSGAGEAVGRMAAAVRDKISDVVGYFTGLPGRVADSLRGLGGLLVRAGVDILDGFLRGLRQGFENVKDFVGGIGSWIAANKGPKAYDLALLQPAGGWIMAGLRRGLAAGMPGLRGDLRGIADTIASTTMPAPGVDQAVYGGSNVNGRADAGATGALSVRVYLGNEEFTDHVRVVVDGVLEDEADAIERGSAV